MNSSEKTKRNDLTVLKCIIFTQRLISGASQLCDDRLPSRFSLFSFTTGSTDANARDSGTGKCLRGHKPKKFLVFFFFFALFT